MIRVVEAKNIQGADVLIGMDVINMGDLAISNFNNQTVFECLQLKQSILQKK